MQFIIEFFYNFPAMMALVAWFTAQIIKMFLIYIFCRDEFSFSLIMASGGMPSSHSATVCALTTAIAITEGVSSVAFAVAGVMSFIVMYDARGVRRSAGEQAQKLNDIIEHLSDNDEDFEHDDPVKEMLGHTPLQVVIGAILGIAVPLIAKLFI